MLIPRRSSTRTRVHLDRVEGLGDFVEIEVVLSGDEGEAAGARVAEDLMRELGIEPADLVEGAYFDLLFPANKSRAARRMEA